MAPHIKTYRRKDDEYGWRLIDGNGEQIAQGEGYTRREDAEDGARNVVLTMLELAQDAGSVSGIGIEET